MTEEMMLQEGAVEITPENTKTFEMRATIAHLDEPGVIYSEVLWNFSIGPVPVVSEDGKRIGSATVYRTDGNTALEAIIHIDYASEERLLVETDSIQFWPRIRGDFLYGRFRSDYMFERLPLVQANAIRVHEVVLTTRKNPDARISRARKAP